MQARGPVDIIKSRTGRFAVKSRRRIGVVSAALVAASAATALAQGPACTRMQFEAAVSDAAGALRDLNAQNRPPFQAKLRALKDKRGWTHDQFLKEAVPLVQDPKISEYDKESGDFLSKIQSMGAEGAAAATPDCSQLTQLRTHMESLVASQQAKWQYMIQRVETELSK